MTLTVKDLDVFYGGLQAVRGVSLGAEAGEITGLIGRNGAGKTSVLSAIAGRVKAPSGSVYFDGKEISGMRPERIARLGISLIPENRHIFSRLTVGENLALASAARTSKTGTKRDIDELTDRFPVLGTTFDRPAALLSGGEQQQLAIARALVAKPTQLLLDEPSLGLAPRLVDQVFELIVSLKDEGKSIVLVEQSVSRALEVANHTCLLEGGAVTFEGDGEAFAKLEGFETRYLGL